MSQGGWSREARMKVAGEEVMEAIERTLALSLKGTLQQGVLTFVNIFLLNSFGCSRGIRGEVERPLADCSE